MTRVTGKPLRLLLLGLVLVLVAAACGGDDDNGDEGGEELSGEILISGSSTVEPISSLNAEKFQSENSGVSISVDGPGSSDGFELFCNGETDISDASRPIAEEEVEICADNGIEFVELKVGIDGITVLTSPENGDVECLDFLDLYALLGPESEGFGNWSDANDLAGEMGAPNTPYPDVPLEVTAPGEESGTYDSFIEIVLEGLAEEREVPEDDIATRPDYTASANDNVIIEGISGSPSSLGWVGYAFFVNNSDVVKALQISNEAEGVDCTEANDETISSGEYPIARDLWIYIKEESFENKPEVEAFVDFYLGEEGFTSVNEVGYVDLAEEDKQITVDNWEAGELGPVISQE
ncbi:MAG: phosphate ABC transporter substrate-binding protein PstS family protein [Actinobacteria bacterium]|nr:phosphate ABC transporter substrate-binding protein PstS family protein [Actinomycetota bacterium]